MSIFSEQDTIIAPITSTNGGSISMVRISGKKALDVASRFFKPTDLRNASGGQFFYGKIVDKKNNRIDDVVLLVFRAPHSFTGEDVVEISCHANPIIVNNILQLFMHNGCRIAEPGEFSKRAFLNGKIDLTQAEAIADLISAKSELAVQNSLTMLEGRLSRDLKQIRTDLIDLAGLLELDLDFSEDGLEIMSTTSLLEKIDGVYKKISRFIESYRLGRELKKGLDVLITGRPNVGKSSLMNAFLGRERVIVSQIPGTTRDVVHEDVMVEDIFMRLIDSAGIRMTDDVVESAGVEMARNFFDKATIILLLLDLSEEPTKEDYNLIKTTSSVYHDKIIIVGNKTDMKINEQSARLFAKITPDKIKVSCKTSKNINKLKKKIRDKILKSTAPFRDEIIITNERQYENLVKAKESLLRVKKAAKRGMSYEFLAIDMRESIDYIGQISGVVTTDDILNTIFSRFCIGK
ncbi:MAG TPA: tRNA uridine-5-carboxymethylaminomethyl(34) synthesis GTPase MnmE [Calditrichaeota bacterium]|nr:tRNA uridine-5-carboxymethylaminomethyl(34) synthesis GTPase MnmE [Calditrichota bacterium]